MVVAPTTYNKIFRTYATFSVRAIILPVISKVQLSFLNERICWMEPIVFGGFPWFQIFNLYNAHMVGTMCVSSPSTTNAIFKSANANNRFDIWKKPMPEIQPNQWHTTTTTNQPTNQPTNNWHNYLTKFIIHPRPPTTCPQHTNVQRLLAFGGCSLTYPQWRLPGCRNLLLHPPLIRLLPTLPPLRLARRRNVLSRDD